MVISLKKKTTIPCVLLLVATALLLTVTLTAPNHGNGNGFDYGLWTALILYPCWYGAMGIVFGLLLSPKHIGVMGAALYVVTFLCFFLCNLVAGHTPPVDALLFFCILYPALSTAIAFLLWGGKRIFRVAAADHRRYLEKRNKS